MAADPGVRDVRMPGLRRLLAAVPDRAAEQTKEITVPKPAKPTPRRGPGRPKNSTIAGFTGRDPGDGLTARQRTILSVIRDAVSSRGFPPSMREIGDAVGLQSTSSVSHQLAVLEQKGYIRRDPNKPRALDVRAPGELDERTPSVTQLHPVTDDALEAGSPAPVMVPLLGRIAA